MKRHTPIFNHPLLYHFADLLNDTLNDISTYSTIETKEERMKIIIHNIDKETIELAKLVSTLQHKEWDEYKEHLEIINKFEERLKDIKEALLLHYDLETWPISQINENSLSFIRSKVSYS